MLLRQFNLIITSQIIMFAYNINTNNNSYTFIFQMSIYQDLCTPAKVYITLAVIYMICAYFSISDCLSFMQANQSKMHPYLNSLNDDMRQSTNGITIANVLFTLFWTWVLNRICSAGYIRVSWFLVLFPYLILFIGIIAYIWFLLKTHISHK